MIIMISWNFINITNRSGITQRICIRYIRIIPIFLFHSSWISLFLWFVLCVINRFQFLPFWLIFIIGDRNNRGEHILSWSSIIRIISSIQPKQIRSIRNRTCHFILSFRFILILLSNNKELSDIRLFHIYRAEKY